MRETKRAETTKEGSEVRVCSGPDAQTPGSQPE